MELLTVCDCAITHFHTVEGNVGGLEDSMSFVTFS